MRELRVIARSQIGQDQTTTSIEEFKALQEALDALQSQRDSLAGENRILRVEHDLLKERLNKFLRKIFAAKSEARSTDQKDMFFNEAEALAAATQVAPSQEESEADDTVDVPGHKRAERGRKPLDPALPRHVVRHELSEAERICPHDGAALKEIGLRPVSSSTSSPSRYA